MLVARTAMPSKDAFYNSNHWFHITEATRPKVEGEDKSQRHPRQSPSLLASDVGGSWECCHRSNSVRVSSRMEGFIHSSALLLLREEQRTRTGSASVFF